MEYAHIYFITDNYITKPIDSNKNNNIPLLQAQEKNNFSLDNFFEYEKYWNIFKTEGLPLDEEEDTINDSHLFNKPNEKCFRPEKGGNLFLIKKSKKFNLFTETETILKPEKYLPQKELNSSKVDEAYNILVKIKRRFLKALIVKINAIDYYINFQKFPKIIIVSDSKERNKILLNMKLLDIFENEELYDKNDLNNYNHNKVQLKRKNVRENPKLKKVLDKTFRELFEEYINSKEFNIDDINELKKKNMKDIYIKRYIYLAKHYIEKYL